MLFLILVLSAFPVSEVSVSSITYTLVDSFYDKEFTNRAIDYFSKNYSLKITEDENKISLIYQIKKNGVSRTELLIILLYLSKNPNDINMLTRKIEKGKDIFEILKEKKYDLNPLYIQSNKIKKEIEKDLDDFKLLKPVIEKEFLNEKK
jgi:hypothetical protein